MEIRHRWIVRLLLRLSYRNIWKCMPKRSISYELEDSSWLSWRDTRLLWTSVEFELFSMFRRIDLLWNSLVPGESDPSLLMTLLSSSLFLPSTSIDKRLTCESDIIIELSPKVSWIICAWAVISARLELWLPVGVWGVDFDWVVTVVALTALAMFSTLPCRDEGRDEQTLTSGVFFSNWDLWWSIFWHDSPKSRIFIHAFKLPRLKSND